MFVTGDANGHTSTLPDYAIFDQFLSDEFRINEDDLRSMNCVNMLPYLDIPVDRSSKCNKVNSHGRKLLDICKLNNLFIVNGRFGKDKCIGNFTFRNISVIDYCLASLDCLRQIESFEVIELDPIFSDGHCLLSTSINFKSSWTESPSTTPKHSPPKWKEDKSSEFVGNLDQDLINNLKTCLNNPPLDANPHYVNDVISQIAQLYSSCAKTTFHPETNSIRNKFKSHSPWFGPQCKKARNKYNIARKNYQLCKSGVNRSNLNKASRFYKQTVNTWVNKHKFNNERKLRSMSSQRPKDYWRYLNSLGHKKCSVTPSISDFFEHFKKVNSEKHSHI